MGLAVAIDRRTHGVLDGRHALEGGGQARLGLLHPGLGRPQAVLGLLHARALYDSWRWALRADDVVARYGVVFRVTRSIPRVRVQHVDVTSGPIDRALGFVQVSLHVAGSAGAVLTIPGLAPAEAETLREALLGSAKVT